MSTPSNVSSVTSKGQVTIPAPLRKRLGLQPGDQVVFVEEDDHIVVRRLETRVESAFGLLKTARSVSLDEIEGAIAEGRARRDRG